VQYLKPLKIQDPVEADYIEFDDQETPKWTFRPSPVKFEYNMLNRSELNASEGFTSNLS